MAPHMPTRVELDRRAPTLTQSSSPLSSPLSAKSLADIEEPLRVGIERITPDRVDRLKDHPMPELAPTSGPVAATAIAAGAGGDPPKRPDGSGLKKPHYLDVEETGRLPTYSLVGIRMADPRGVRRPAFVDPASRSETSEETRALALRQTTAARGLLYNPGDTLRRELGLAAGALRAMAAQLTVEEQRALGARILGSEGLLPRQSPDRLLDTLRRVENDPRDGAATATDRAAVIALMGDIGALYADTGATTGVENRSVSQAQNLREQLFALARAADLDGTTPDTVRSVQSVGGSSAVGPAKKQERIRPENDKPPRTGIHNLGREADIDLDIPDRSALPTSRWDVAHIRRDRVDRTEEPLVGHMSGSPAEILQVWDMLRGVPANRQYVGVLDAHREARESGHAPIDPMTVLNPEQQQAHMARASGASAFLVGLGYHSAVEVLEGVLAYTGQNARSVLPSARQDAGHLFGRGAATDLLIELWTSTSKSSKGSTESS